MCICSLSCGDYGAQIQRYLGAKAAEGCKIEGMFKQVVGKGTEFFLQISFQVCCSFSTNWVVNF